MTWENHTLKTNREPPTMSQAQTPSDFDDLDSLLNESVSLVREAKAVKESRSALKRSGSVMDATERQFIEAKVAEWEARNTWRTIELVAVFRRQSCACGTAHRTFSHFMHHQQHRSDAFAQRWVSAAYGVEASDDAALPRAVAYTDSIVPICEYCAEHGGFDLDASSAVAWAVNSVGANSDA